MCPTGGGTNHQVATISSSLGQSVTSVMDFATSGYYPYEPPYVPDPPPGYVPPDPKGPNILTALGTVIYNDVIDPARPISRSRPIMFINR